MAQALEPEGHPPTGLQNTCWAVVQYAEQLWFAIRRSSAPRAAILRHLPRPKAHMMPQGFRFIRRRRCGGPRWLNSKGTEPCSLAIDRTRLASGCGRNHHERQLHKLVGLWLWAFAFKFRRPLFSFFEAVYNVGHPEGRPDDPNSAHQSLFAKSCNWLALLLWVATLQCVLGPRPSTKPRDRANLDRGRVTPATAQIRNQLPEKFVVTGRRVVRDAVGDTSQHKSHPIYTASERIWAVMNLMYLFLLYGWAPGIADGVGTSKSCRGEPSCTSTASQGNVTTALSWQWMHFALMLLLGCFARLRPCENLGYEPRIAFSQQTSDLPGAGAGENTNSRRSAPERAVGRAVRRSVSAEVPEGYGTRREVLALALLSQSVPSSHAPGLAGRSGAE